ncbi:Protein Hook [Grifola frondosa]|uniref:Protein Hook n=1 Tax=Grifola frondosa TaxID=5627 RepID=A0A1C7MFV7_GRIFR|nr:Protein Hook [Grifola frondosa]
MSDSQRKELNAFLSFFGTFDLSRPATTVADLSDGAALTEILSVVDAEYFRQSTRPSAQPSDNWVLRFSALKRLYRLMTQYFSEVLHQPTSALEVPDLQAIAKDYDIPATLIMCHLIIAIAVQCEKNKDIIEKIQRLGESDQHSLMRVIEQVMAKVKVPGDISEGEVSMTEDDHYYQIQSERSRILSEKETLEKVYQTLLEEHRTLQTNFDDAVSEKDDALASFRQAQKEADSKRVDSRGDALMRAEIDRLRSELQKSEDNLAMAESEL